MPLSAGARQVLARLSAESAAGPADSELLARFVATREEAAFALLVERHAPVVLGVCRRALGNSHDAEDAAQAVFLLLARNARRVRKPESLAAWLHGVAVRVSRKALARRSTPEPLPDAVPAAEQLDSATWADARRVIDEALAALPESLRVPLVLCYLEGLTRDEAAARLGWSLPTLHGRLGRGRDRLRAALARRGFPLAAGLVAVLLESPASAAPAWVAATTTLVNGPVPAGLAPLIAGVLPMKSLLAPVLAFVCCAGLATGLLVAGQGRGGPPAAPPVAAAPAADAAAPALFEDVTKAAGVEFTYRNGEEAGHFAILESLGGGVALLDYDGDGLLDIFLTGGGEFTGPDKQTIAGRPCKLFRNLGKGQFRDVTAAAGLDKLAGGKPWFYSHGVAVGDYDCDGWPDLIVTGYGRIALFHNEPDGKGGRKFADVSAAAGLDRGIEWATSAAFADFDADGYPDLYVCQYVDWSFANHPACTSDGKTPEICPPRKFQGLPDKVYRNDGAGKFIDVSNAVGLDKGGNVGKSLGVVVVDIDGDGKPDVYVAKDTVDNFLYLNKSARGKILFEEVGLLAGVARDDRGVPNGSTGTDAGDPERTGKPALWVTNYENELHALYRNNSAAGRRPIFLYRSTAAGVAAIGQKYVGWGTAFLDADLDGWEDLFVANGHTLQNPAGNNRKQHAVLLLNQGNGRFRDASRDLGAYRDAAHLGRGVAVGDLDNDGRPDIVISHLNEPVAILRGTGGKDNHWLGVRLEGKDRADVVGAKVVWESDGQRQTRFAKAGGSFASSGDRRLVFGLGSAKAGKLTVTWPDGKEQAFTDLRVDRYYRITQGREKPEPEGEKK